MKITKKRRFKFKFRFPRAKRIRRFLIKRSKNLINKKNKKKFLPALFSFVVVISVFINNNARNFCEAEEKEKINKSFCKVLDENVLYTMLNKLMDDGFEVEIKSNKPNEPTKVEKVSFDEYILGVLAGEISPSAYPDEAVAAMAVAAKNYACYHAINYLMQDGKLRAFPTDQSFQVYLNEQKREAKYGKNWKKYEENLKRIVARVKPYFVITNQTIEKKNSPINSKQTIKRLANTVYFSSSNGKTESAKNAWGSLISYLDIVDCSFEKIEEKRIEIDYDKVFDLVNKFAVQSKSKQNNKKQNQQQPNSEDKKAEQSILAKKPEKFEDAIKIISRTESDRVKEVVAFDVKMTGDRIRKLLNLPSNSFEIEFKKADNKDAANKDKDKNKTENKDANKDKNKNKPENKDANKDKNKNKPENKDANKDKNKNKPENKDANKDKDKNKPENKDANKDKIIFKCKGFGHGVGMSQHGALAMAKQEKDFMDILKHYYKGVEIKTIDELKNNDITNS